MQALTAQSSSLSRSCWFREQQIPQPSSVRSIAQGFGCASMRTKPSCLSAGRADNFTRTLRPNSQICAMSAGTGLRLEHETSGKRDWLIAIDAAPGSTQAVAWAARNLVAPGDSLHLLHLATGVAPLPPKVAYPGGHLPGVSSHTPEDEKRRQHQEHVNSVTSHLAGQYRPVIDKSGAHLHVHVLPQSAQDSAAIGQAICQTAEDMQAAAVVIASHSKGGLQEFVRGSVAAYAIKNCPRPVAVLHSNKISDSAGSLGGQAHISHVLSHTEVAPSQEKGANGESVGPKSDEPGLSHGRRWLVAVGNVEESMNACQWIVKNLYHQGDHIHLVHILPCLSPALDFPSADLLSENTLGSAHGGWLGIQESEKQVEEARAAAREWGDKEGQLLCSLLDKARAAYTFEVDALYTENPVESISDALNKKAKEISASAVVLSYHHHSPVMEFLMGSVTSHMAKECPNPLLVLHGTKQVLSMGAPTVAAGKEAIAR